LIEDEKVIFSKDDAMKKDLMFFNEFTMGFKDDIVGAFCMKIDVVPLDVNSLIRSSVDI